MTVAPDAPTSVVPATTGQRLLWALDRVRGHTGALNCPLVCWIDGPLDVAALGRALGELVSAHASLRTTLVAGRTLAQAIHDPRSVVVETTVPATPDDGDAGERALAEMREELTRRVDPTRSPIRIRLWRTARDRHLLLVNVHHAMTDLWSSNVLFEDLATALAGGTVRPPAWQLWEFAERQRRSVDGGSHAPHERYWAERLAGVSPIAIPLDHPAGATRMRSIAPPSEELAVIDGEVAGWIRETGRTSGTSVFSVLLALFYAAVHRLYGPHDIAVGSLFANRLRPELQRTVGFLVTLLVLRVRLPEAPTFLETLAQCDRACRGAFLHQELAFHSLSPPPPAPPGRRYDDVVFQLAPGPIGRRLAAGDLELEAIVPDVSGRFDVELAVMAAADGAFAVKLSYDPRLADHEAKRLVREFVRLGAAVRSAAHDPLAELRTR